MNIKETLKNTGKTIKNTLKTQDKTKTETLTAGQFLQNLIGGKGIHDAFINDIYNEEQQTPHQEMQRIRKMRLRNAFVESAVDTVADLLLGKEQYIKSEDETTQKYFNEKYIQNSNILETMRNTAQDFIAYGNYYFQKQRGVNTGTPLKYHCIAHPERMWRKIENEETQSYIYEIPTQIAQKHSLNQYTVGYGDYNKKTVYGVKYETNEISSGRMGQGDYKYYGRSPLASTINDHKILKEIERSMAIFSRYKSVPKKLISMKGSDDQPLSTKEFDETINDWRQLNDFQNFVTNGKNFDVEDMDYAGSQVNFQPMIDYLKRKITSVLGPEFYFHGENTTHAVSNAQKTTFYLRIQSWRDQFLDAWNEVIKEVAEKKGLSTDVE